MRRAKVTIGFVPLVDAATLIVAHALGFAEEEGLELTLAREPSWSNIRDKVALGLYPAAHMLAPMPLAMTLGAGAIREEVVAPFVLAVGGNVVGVSTALAQSLWCDGGPPWGDAARVGRTLLRAFESRPIRFAVPFPHSMHLELTRYWIEGCGGDPDRDIAFQTVPPPLMSEALAAGQVDVFCVGEPWGSTAVERGVASIVLTTADIWSFAPEKVLGVRRAWAESEPETLTRLLRSLHRASRWIARRQNHATAAELLARPEYLAAPALLIERGLSGALVVSPTGEQRQTPRFLDLGSPEATFPWRSQSLWIAARAGLRWGMERVVARDAAARCFRPDLFRRALAPLGVDLPGASSKVEGGLESRTGVASARGELFLGPDRFFDGRRFDPTAPAP